jgi:hypothetical protein
MGILYVISTLLKDSILDILDKSISIWIIKSLGCFLEGIWGQISDKQKEKILRIFEKALLKLFVSEDRVELREQLWKIYCELVNKK